MTGVVYGFLRDIVSLQDQHCTDYIAFAFDRGRSRRELVYPAYKSNRREKVYTSSEETAYNELQRQIRSLRREYLPEAGFRNIFSQKGYEADDVLASLCHNLRRQDEAIIVSADQDLYQLLSPRVSIYNPGKRETITQDSFARKFGVDCAQWPDVKAIAGCVTDCIQGIRGVGVKTAAKFLAGNLKPKSKAFESIVKGDMIWKQNIKLVRLPYPGTNQFEFQDDEVTRKKWRGLTSRLGMETLRNEIPFIARG